MCKAKTPTYTPPKQQARERAPDNSALLEEAAVRAAMRGGGAKRSTILTGFGGAPGPLVLGAQGTLGDQTVLGQAGLAGRVGEAALDRPNRPIQDFSSAPKPKPGPVTNNGVVNPVQDKLGEQRGVTGSGRR